MARARRDDFSKLSPREAKIVGEVDDYAWDEATVLPARVRPATTQFSLRVDPKLLEQLQNLANAASSTVSDVAREALERFVESGGRPALSNIVVSFPKDAGMLVSVQGGQAVVSPNRRETPLRQQPDPLENRSLTY